jgi:hypothetical protein
MFDRSMTPASSGPTIESPADPGEVLLDLASRMDSDGGMPGKSTESRAIATVIALLAFLSQGHTPTGGTFRSHVARLTSFLKSLTGSLTVGRKSSPPLSN